MSGNNGGSELHPRDQIILRTPEGLVVCINEMGALVESLTDPDGQDLLFPRGKIDGRGGIPICAPVFGPGDAVGLPQHGFFRDLDWKTVAQGESRLELTLDNPGLQDPTLVGSAYEGLYASLTVEANSEADTHSLSITMLIGNNGDNEAIVTPGFHPYFPISDISVEDLNVYYDKEIRKIDPKQLSEPQTLPKNDLGEIGIESDRRTVTMRTSNLPRPVLWTAHPDKYVCVEPTSAGFATASVETKLDDQCVLTKGMENSYFMQIKWWPPKGTA